MRVTIVSRIYRPEPSAASLFLGSVSDALRAEGHDVTVLTARPAKGTTSTVAGEDVRTFPVLRDRDGYVRGYLPYLSFDIPLALRLLFARRPDVVLVEPPPTTGVVARVVCAIRRIPYVYDAADIWSDAADMATDSRTVIRVLRAMERFALQGARAFVTISDGVVARVRAMGVDAPSVVTGFGADTSEFSVTGEQPQRLFLYAGSYAAWHGADIMIDAFADFSSTDPGYTLRVIGNGTERPALEERARSLGVADSVEFLDPIPPSELNTHFAAAVASIATLKPDTGYDFAFATKTYSSLAAGCPVIFTGPGPTAPFLRSIPAGLRAGAACEYDPRAVADAMRQVAAAPVSEPERRAIAAWIDAHHSMRAVADRVVQVLTDVARRSSR